MTFSQRNSISKLENVSHLSKLKKLYLSGNKISVVENLECLSNLTGMVKYFPFHVIFLCNTRYVTTELHIDHQRLEPHQNLVFDPRSCKSLNSLNTVDASGSNMVTLQPIQVSIHFIYNVNNNYYSQPSGWPNGCLFFSLKSTTVRPNHRAHVSHYFQSFAAG